MDIKRSSYTTDSDIFLIDFFQNPNSNSSSIFSNFNEKVGHSTYNLPNNPFKTLHLNITAISLIKSELNNLYHIAGSTTNMLLKHCCNECQIMLKINFPTDELLGNIKTYLLLLNKGRFKEPCLELLQIIYNCELLYKKYRMYVFYNSTTNLIQKIITDLSIDFLKCI